MPCAPRTYPLGKHVRSPLKLQNAKRTKNVVKIPGQEEKVLALRKRMDDILAGSRADANEAGTEDAEETCETEDAEETHWMDVDENAHHMGGYESNDSDNWFGPEKQPIPFPAPPAPSKSCPAASDLSDSTLEYHSVPENHQKIQNPTSPVKLPELVSDAERTKRTLLENWKTLLPKLQSPLLHYRANSRAKVSSPVVTASATCSSLSCVSEVHSVLCLYFDHFRYIQVTSCRCENTAQVLVKHGLFPASPTAPETAIAIVLLDFYRALFERSCEAVHALAAALQTVYLRRGYSLLGSNGDLYKEPFRRGLGYAIQWYDCLHIETERIVDAAVDASDALVQSKRENQENILKSPLPSTVSPSELKPCTLAELRSNVMPVYPGPVPAVGTSSVEDTAKSSGSTAPPPTPARGTLTPGECHRMLQKRCPACFGETLFGRTLHQGGDIHVSVDGNFHHKHTKSSAEDLDFYNPQNFLSKEYVDAVGVRNDKARQAPPRAYKQVVPDSAVDGCQDAHHAAKGDEASSSEKSNHFDNKGLMALVCQHDIPLFFTNIDTPGEQQKYVHALLEYLFSMLPPQAVVVVLYDIGCVVDRSINKYDLLPDWIACRIQFVTSAMHAYGHEWSCQLVYNPRLQRGLGLTDGEGTERLWSRLRKLIGIERRSGRKRRIWLIDRQSDAIANDLRDGLGDWINHRSKKLIPAQAKKAQAILDKCRVEIDVLRTEWAAQTKAQLSSRAKQPAILKKELEKVLALQTEVDGLEAVVDVAKKAMQAARSPKSALRLIASLKANQKELLSQVEELYSSLNVVAEFPELVGLDLDYVKNILLAHDLKMSIRKRAVGTFWEWERLDQSVRGKHQTIAIAKRKPALMRAIARFNKLVRKLTKWSNIPASIPPPLPLPTDLQGLRDCQDLAQDVWITPSSDSGPGPRWLTDPNTRQGMQAMLKLDRCLEEQRRLNRESDNLLRSFGRELTALEVALRNPEYSHLASALEERRSHLWQLKPRWITPSVSQSKFDYAISNARSTAMSIAGESLATELLWITTNIVSSLDLEAEAAEVIEAPAAETFVADLLAVELFEHNSDCEEPLVSGESDSDSGFDSDEGIVAHNHVFFDLELPQLSLPSWTKLKENCTDPSLSEQCHNLEPNITDSDPCAPRGLPGTSIRLDRSEIQRLVSSKGWLNSGCINSLAQLISHLLGDATKRYSILSSFIVPGAVKDTDSSLWRTAKGAEYWEKDVWIIPVHREEEHHWVLAVIIPSQRAFYLFDSYAGGEQSWESDLSKLMVVVHRLTRLAQSHGHDLVVETDGAWTATPLINEAIQTNGHDCGLWILAGISSVLRGYTRPGLSEKEMPQFRKLLLAQVHTLSLW
ncbi:hypothetical protein C8J56DRAFT_1049993 [Mycena floridula]|nr:hypothetical protein C8J56DRAFT_1049993 [Mycena floridula]